MYTVRMVRVTATEARRRLFKLMDAVERGEEVTLERRGVRFRLALEAHGPSPEIPSSPLRILDPDLLDGEWTWQTGEDGELVFRSRRRDA
ncbi:MAG: type II toxin-antitoxin system prevent-host-death family antitoxin [Acidobacteriota bacterium]|nr:type II toxin-antitoxin system prevent-host-death family antitoxin [Acidobacteriota bacterium]